MKFAEQQKFLARQNARYTNDLVPVPRAEWGAETPSSNRVGVYRSRRFLVQVFEEQQGIVRLTVNRTTMIRPGVWQDGITWDELQKIKNDLGYRDRDAVEMFPRERDTVNVANMRHLWVLPAILPFGWRSTKGPRDVQEV